MVVLLEQTLAGMASGWLQRVIAAATDDDSIVDTATDLVGSGSCCSLPWCFLLCHRLLFVRLL